MNFDNEIIQELLGPLNIGFTVVMLILFLISLWKIFKYPKESSTIPNLVAAIGIIGTFVGIFWGLLKFDTNKLDMSIPSLLNGMKTAFLTSILGLVLSNILKSIHSSKIKKVISKEKEAGKLEEASLENISELLAKINNSLEKNNELAAKSFPQLLEAINQLNTNLSAESNKIVGALNSNSELTKTVIGETISTQTTELLSKLNEAKESAEDKSDKLLKEFREFAVKMAENNMKAFTEAIQACIADLNNQLQDQFGENFKQLNQAVEKLLDWQVHYKETVEVTTENQKEIYKGMEEARNLVKEIADKSYSIVEVANRLGDKIVTFDTQEKMLNESIQVLTSVAEEAKVVFSNLDGYFQESSEKLNENLDKSIQNIESYIVDTDGKINEVQEKVKEQHRALIESIKELNVGIKNTSDMNIESMKEQIKNIEEAFVILRNDSAKLTANISDNIQKMVEDNNRNLEESVETINRELGEALTISLNSLGNQLAMISEKFVEDYTPLTERLEALIKMAERGRR